jgi:hypothetical protein
MDIPHGEPVHQNLSTTYTDISMLLATLKEDGFAGIIELTFPGSSGALFLRAGEVINAVIEEGTGRNLMVGLDVLHQIVALSNAQDGVLSIYRMPSHLVEGASIRLGSQIIHRGLSTGFVKLDRFLGKLVQDKHHGFIDFFTEQKGPVATLFLKGGLLIGLEVNGPESEPPSFLEGEAIGGFLDKVVVGGALFDVYQSLNGCLQNDQRSREDWSAGYILPATETSGDDRNAVPEEEAVQVDRISQEGAAIGKETDQPYKGSVSARDQLVSAFEDLLVKVENFVDGLSQEGIFQRAFKRSLIEKSETYPFLDPFSGEFRYEAGLIELGAGPDPEMFAKGLVESFNLTLSYLKKEFPKDMKLPPGLTANVELALKHFQNEESQSGHPSLPPLLIP